MQAGDGEGGSDRPDAFWQVHSEGEGLAQAAGPPVCQHNAQGRAHAHFVTIGMKCLPAMHYSTVTQALTLSPHVI